MAYLRGYNYFDDDYDIEYKSNGASKISAAFQKAFDEIAHRVSNASVSLEKPSLKMPSVGFTAGVLILIAAAIVLTSIIFSVHLKKDNSDYARFYSDAGDVCTNIITNYGTGKAEPLEIEKQYSLTGLSYARQMDFNDDGKSELLTAYNNNNVYYVEVWGYDGDEFTKLYSNKANSIEDQPLLGSWITIYHHSGKYYIGELSDEDDGQMNLLSLSSKKFKISRECRYDAENDIYAMNDKINSVDFETIKLSYITANRAERTLDIVASNIDDFKTTNSQPAQSEKTEAQLKNEAYYEIIQKYNQEYGRAEYDSTSEVCFAKGLCVVSLIDFNGDGNEELLTIYRYDKKVAGEDAKGNYQLETEPEYKLEVYKWNGSSAVRAFENDGISTMQNSGSNQRFYILQNDDGKVNLCKNTYTYGKNSERVWKGTSRISAMDENGEFDSSFVAVVDSDYGYLSYQLNGKRVYRQEFNSKGYIVPYFCNEDDYDTDAFSVIYLQGRAQDGAKIKNAITETQKTIKSINPNYSV